MPYVECNYIRRVFREYVEKSGLDEMYDVSEERNGNVVLTSRFARHRDMGTTSRYINTDKKEIYDV
ncbi:MAG: hypothetical protein KGI00_04135, partial [Candidatus Micrarchaeota archaeon]|nr:hypothetical protein [Candidatus Micrarchaeota archaeon]